MGNWSELPKDLLSAIARRLAAAADRARFSGVCRNWSSLAKSEINYLPCNPPWLMLTEKPDSDDRGFVVADGNERFELELPEARGSCCVGSTGCCLVMIDAAGDMYILNPFSRAMIDLPPLRSFDGYMVDIWDIQDHYVRKVVLYFPQSQSPVEEDFIAVAIYSPLSKLAYTKKGAKSWQTIKSVHYPFVDVIIYQDKFYTVNSAGIVFHCSPDEKPKTVPISYPVDSSATHNQRYLVESQGLLLQVLNLDYNWGSSETRGFHVFELDFTTGRWVKLNDLGQHSIFLGYNTSVALLATSSSAFKPNCIYFSTVEYFPEWVFGKWIDAGYLGVFHIADSIIVPYYTGPYSGSPVWIVPTSLSQNQ